MSTATGRRWIPWRSIQDLDCLARRRWPGAVGSPVDAGFRLWRWTLGGRVVAELRPIRAMRPEWEGWVEETGEEVR